MKKIKILVLSLAVSIFGLSESQAQMSFTQEELEAFQAKVRENAEKSGGEGRSRRRETQEPSQTGLGDGGLGLEKRWEDIAAGKGTEKKNNKGGFGIYDFNKPAGSVTKAVDSTIQKILKKQITVIAGDRVTDAVTGELLDDAREIRVDEDTKDEYYDDGTHGDLVAGDGQYTRVNEITGVIGPNNQRIKEQLIQALYEASRLDGREFYGHTLVSTDHSTRPERNVRWALVEPPADRVGFRISEIATDKTVKVPDFWEEEASRDVKIAGPNGWARSFLDEYRVEKGGLTSDFYPPYVPNPPSIPKLPPPSAEGWTPFIESYDPEAETQQTGFGGPAAQQAKGGQGSMTPFAGMAAGFANRGAGKGSTSGGYFDSGN